MEFETKTALIEHIKELVNDGYLKENLHIQQHEAGTSGFKYYTINYDAVKKDD
jgi:predicted transcriptional regulator